MNMLISISTLILLATVYFLMKRYEPRMVLFLSGLILCTIAWAPIEAFLGFSKAIKAAPVIETIAGSMAFAYVMQYTKCDAHLVHLLSSGLTKLGPKLLIPGAIFITSFVHMSVPSAAGCVASVGPVLIPILKGAGVHPVMAATILFAGTFGATMLHPGFHQNVIISEATHRTPVDIVGNHFYIVLIVGAVVIVGVTLVAYYLKEQSGYVDESMKEEFQVDILKALSPLVPLLLILLGSMNIIPALKVLKIAYAMIIGAMVLCVVTRTGPGEITKAFFKGFGEGFQSIYGIIICSGVFVAGLTTCGLLKVMIDFMKTNPDLARLTGSFGPFVLAVICGSGDAASLAFNQAITPLAGALGIAPMDLGSSAAFAGCLGRTMSPVAGCAMVCCALAGTDNPVDLAKRNAPVMIVAVTVMTILFFMHS